MTSRLPWAGDPRAMWKLWDDFGMAGTRMIGYWADSCPVQTGRTDVLATVYAKKGKSLICLASWAREPVCCRLRVNWKALGLDAEKVRLTAAPIQGFQSEAAFAPEGEIVLAPGKGWLIIAEE